MSKETGIQWTDATWNPWVGCTKVSPGCAHCYMFRDQVRYGQDPTHVRRTSPPTFNAPLKWAEGRRIFTCSWSDWFHEAADAWRDAAWEIIRQTPQHTYQILTKRPERIAATLPADWGTGYPNVWLGVSAENQTMADRRIPLLVRIPAIVHFVSYEPALGPVDFQLSGRNYGRDFAEWSERLDWIIVGGESGGHEARPFNPGWAANLITQGRDTRTAVFVKQMGSVWARANHAKDSHGGDMAEWPAALRVREFPQTGVPSHV